jgi:peptide deformylase
MILPIEPYGSPVLRRVAEPVEADSPALQGLIDDMIETMHGAAGIGLAAPQVGHGLRLFVVDLSRALDDDEAALPEDERAAWARGPIAFLNPEIVDEDDLVAFEEGCLSIPDVREDVTRPDWVRVRFLDRHFRPHEWEAEGMLARVIQHEYDHLEGVLFIDRISAFRRRLLKRRLRDIQRGAFEPDYPMALEA